MIVGLRFETVGSSVQAELDRYFFALLGRKARARAGAQPERRLSPRVELGDADRLQAQLVSDRPLGALSDPSAGPAAPTLRVHDLSTTGCGLLCDEPTRFTLRQRVRLRLVGEGLAVELWARVIRLG